LKPCPADTLNVDLLGVSYLLNICRLVSIEVGVSVEREQPADFGHKVGARMRIGPRRRKFRDLLRRGDLWGYYLESELVLRTCLRRTLPSPRFVIFAQGRTGSRLLCELLDSHSGIDCDFEMLADPVRDVHRYVRNLAPASIRPAYGFKVKIYQLKHRHGIGDSATFLRQLHEQDWRIINLKRRNLFRQVYSGLARQVRGKAHSRPLSDGSAPVPPSVSLDVAEIVRLIRLRQKMLRRERRALKGLPVKTLVYEDDLFQPFDQQRTVHNIVEWLGLTPEPVHTDMIPNTPRNLRDVIANFDEVEAALRGTEFETFFAEATGA